MATFRFARLPAAAAPRLQMRSVPRHPAHLHLHLLRSPPHPVASTAQVVRPAPIRSLGQRCSPRQSLQCRRQVSCPFLGEKYGTPRHPNLLSTPQVRASDLFDLTLNELSGFAAQAPDPVLQHVRRLCLCACGAAGGGARAVDRGPGAWRPAHAAAAVWASKGRTAGRPPDVSATPGGAPSRGSGGPYGRRLRLEAP